jgi:histidinol dehydrogenase
MNIINWSQKNKTQVLSRVRNQNNENIKIIVEKIITKVKQEGDRALFSYSSLFDGVKLDSLKVNCNSTQPEIKDAINKAYSNIKRFHELQFPRDIESNKDGIKTAKSWLPIENVGLYIPGGTAPLVSTLLMLAIPAKLAGCKNIVCVTPPNVNGGIDNAICYAAKLCGIDCVYSIGGAQAIAALAYGTESIPKVDKIFGPGNKYVTEAKLQVSMDPLGATLDMPAGPSEVLVIADSSANPNLVAADLLAQAEHDPDAVAICVTTDKKLAEKIKYAVKEQIYFLDRQDIINEAMKNSFIIIVDDLKQAFDVSNEYAPEHLIITVKNASRYKSFVKNAGSVFVGEWSAEALGDYASGPNHVLPTYGYAKSYSCLGVESFMKSISFQEVSKQGLLNIASTVESLSSFEGLSAHKNSVVLRRLLLENQ